jgi:hypothetical protein
MKRPEIKQAAATISRILGKVHDGTLDASGAVASGIVRRLEGAQSALEAASEPSPKPKPRKPRRKR